MREPSTPAPLSTRARATTVGVLSGIQLLMALIPFGIGALAPIVRDRFDLSRGEVGLATTAVFTSVALLSIPMGRLADGIGVARSLVAAGALVAAATAGLALAERFEVFLALLLIVGVGYAAVTPATNKGIVRAVPARVRGRAMGIKQMGVTGGGMVAAAVLPATIQSVGWRPTLLTTGLAIGLLVWAGAGVYRQLVRDDTSTPGAGARAAHGVATRRLLGLGVIIGLMIGAQHAVGTHLSLFLVDERAMTVTGAAAALTLLHSSGTAARLGWGYVSDRVPGGRWRTVGLIGSTSVGALILLALVGRVLPAGPLIVLVVLLGVSTQAGNAVFQTALAEEDEERAGRVSGIGMSIGFAGAIVAPPTFGMAVDAAGSYTGPFLVVAGVVAAATVAAFRLAPAPGPAAAIVSEVDGSLA
ncbi:MAG TPA: MFS transporter [Actinomycetota bacterium]|nr:MFS transporter [Actinomycetota bacterium]